MSELKCKKVSYIEVDYSDLEDLINKYYFPGIGSRKAFCFPASEECGNDSSHTFEIDGEVDEYELDRINRRSTTYMTAAYLNDLAKRDIIEKGEYLVQVSW